MNWEDVIIESSATDTGMRRTNNQDSLAIVRAPTAELFKSRGHLFMVADGMGAHAVGELASKLACDYIPHTYHKTRNLPPAEALTKAYQDVGGEIFKKAAANPDFHRMGTTCTTLVLLPGGALVAHVGDSRAYRVRAGRIDQLSFDHSLVWELVRKGHMKHEQAQKAYPRNVITRSLGPEPTVEVDIEGMIPVETGDVYLLCSDGLSGPVTDPEIGVFASHFHPEAACQYLVHLANLRGGSDNITAVIVRVGPWVEPGTEPPSNGIGTKKRGSFFSGLLNGLRSRNQELDDAFEPHQSAECVVNRDFIATLVEDIKNAQALAVDQAWQVDWPAFTVQRKQTEEAIRSSDWPGALKPLAESISIMGTAGRLHRKEALNQNRG